MYRQTVVMARNFISQTLNVLFCGQQNDLQKAKGVIKMSVFIEMLSLK